MTNEDRERMQRMERNMEVIVEHQAKFSVDIDRINETLAKHTEMLAKHSEMLGKHNEAIGGLLQVSRTLIDHQMAVDERMPKIEVRMAELALAHKETDERLSAFITIVEKYISSRNGRKN